MNDTDRVIPNPPVVPAMTADAGPLGAQAHSLPGDVGTDALRKALRPFANAAKWWKAFDNQHRITTLHQHGDCLEVGHLRAAEAALTPSALSGDATGRCKADLTALEQAFRAGWGARDIACPSINAVTLTPNEAWAAFLSVEMRALG